MTSHGNGRETVSERRRRFLKATVLAGVGTTGLGMLPGSGAAATTVSGGGDALQNAIDAAGAGDVLEVVDSATYDPIAVDESLTVTSSTDADPTIDGGGTSTAVSIEADDVTFEAFTVTNPGGLLGVKIQPGYDDVSILDNTVDDVGPTGRFGVTGVLLGQGDHDGIEISNNVIRNLDQETTVDSEFPTANGILFDANNTVPGTVSNAVVNENTIRDIESDVAPLGIVLQHETVGVDVNNNEIGDLVADPGTDADPTDGGDFEFTFAQGINVDSPSTTDTVVAHNRIEDVTSELKILPEAVKIDGDGSGLTLRANEFLVAIGVNNRNGTDGGNRDTSTDPVVDARNNWWGGSQGPEEADDNQDADDDDRADVVGNVAYEPFLRRPPGESGR